MLEQLLSRLGLEQGEVTTYITLWEKGPLSAGTLSKRTGTVRVTQYLFLKRLIEKGFVTQSLKQGVKLFTAEAPEKMMKLYEEKIQSLNDDYHLYKKLLPQMNAKRSDHVLAPKFQIFEGAEGLKNVLKDMLLYRNMETQAYWPIKQMLETLSGEFFHYHNKERIRNNLYTRAIWPQTEVIQIKEHPYLGAGKIFKREIRITPKDTHFTMGYWIYGNKVAFLSSRKESFGYIIESKEFADMMRSQFEIMWTISKPLKMQMKDVEKFLKEIE